MLLARRVEAGRDHRFSGIFEPAVPLYASAYCHFMGKGTLCDLNHKVAVRQLYGLFVDHLIKRKNRV